MSTTGGGKRSASASSASPAGASPFAARKIGFLLKKKQSPNDWLVFDKIDPGWGSLILWVGSV